MGFSSLLRNRKRHSAPRQRPAFRPALEALEDRCVPSTLKVTNNYDSGKGSLRYEIAQVTSKNYTIVFDKSLNGQTITLTTGELVISQSLRIEGPGASKLTITSQQWVSGSLTTYNGSRIFEVDGAATTVTISGLTMSNGGGTRLSGGYTGYANDGYGGAILNFGRLALSGCNLGTDIITSGNDAEYGGAIANLGQLSVTGCSLQNNTAYGSAIGGAALGGAIYNSGSLTISGGEVWYNSAAAGGGIYNAGTMTVSGCTLDFNTAAYGGGIYNESSFATATVSNSTISDNFASTEGGGIYNAGTAAALTVSSSSFRGNSPDNIYGPYTDGGGNTFN